MPRKRARVVQKLNPPAAGSSKRRREVLLMDNSEQAILWKHPGCTDEYCTDAEAGHVHVQRLDKKRKCCRTVYSDGRFEGMVPCAAEIRYVLSRLPCVTTSMLHRRFMKHRVFDDKEEYVWNAFSGRFEDFISAFCPVRPKASGDQDVIVILDD